MLSSAGAVEFDTVIAPSGQIAVLSPMQRAKVSASLAGRIAHVCADEHSIHILIDGKLVRTVPPNLGAEELQELRMRGARPAGPPSAAASAARIETLPGCRG